MNARGSGSMVHAQEEEPSKQYQQSSSGSRGGGGGGGGAGRGGGGSGSGSVPSSRRAACEPQQKEHVSGGKQRSPPKEEVAAARGHHGSVNSRPNRRHGFKQLQSPLTTRRYSEEGYDAVDDNGATSRPGSATPPPLPQPPTLHVDMLGSPPPTLLGAEYYSCNNNTGWYQLCKLQQQHDNHPPDGASGLECIGL